MLSMADARLQQTGSHERCRREKKRPAVHSPPIEVHARATAHTAPVFPASTKHILRAILWWAYSSISFRGGGPLLPLRFPSRRRRSLSTRRAFATSPVLRLLAIASSRLWRRNPCPVAGVAEART